MYSNKKAQMMYEEMCSRQKQYCFTVAIYSWVAFSSVFKFIFCVSPTDFFFSHKPWIFTPLKLTTADVNSSRPHDGCHLSSLHLEFIPKKTHIVYLHELGLKAVDSSSKPCHAPPAAQCFLPAARPVLHSHMSPLPESETWTQFRIRLYCRVPHYSTVHSCLPSEPD